MRSRRRNPDQLASLVGDLLGQLDPRILEKDADSPLPAKPLPDVTHRVDDGLPNHGVPNHSVPVEAFDSIRDEKRLLAAWKNAVQHAIDQHPRRITKRARQLDIRRVEIEIVPDQGHVKGAIHTRREKLRLAIQLDPAGFFGGCRCPASGMAGPCVHSYVFLQRLLTLLHDPKSELSDLIRRTANPNRARFHDALHQLDRVVHAQWQKKSPDFLPEVPLARLIWQIDWESDGVEIRPKVQRPRKRGGGWTKGALLELDKLVDSPELLTSDTDHRARAAVVVRGFSYYGQPFYRIDTVRALEALAGHDLVVHDDEPVTIAHLNLTLDVAPRDKSYLVRLAIPTSRRRALRTYGYENGLVAIDASTNTVYVIPHSELLESFVKSVADGLFIDHSELLELLSRLEKLDELVGVILPEEEFGPIIDSPATPMMLLRSNSMGHLECGIRFRDSHGRYHCPGEGATPYRDTCDGQPIQRHRDLAGERRQARELVEELALPEALGEAPWTWRIYDIDDSLQLLAQVEQLTKCGRLEVAWDAKSPKPMRVLGRITSQSLRVVVKEKRDWFDIDGSCSTEFGELSLAELLEGLEGRRQGGYIEVRPGEFAEISRELILRLRKLRDVAYVRRKRLEISPVAAPVVRSLLDHQIDVEAPLAWQECIERLERSEQLEPTPPQTFRGTLRDYQVDGYCWLRRLAEWGVGACLADDMGLGKTIQMLAVLIDRRDEGPSLVIAPTSVGFNWVREAEEFAPDLSAHLYRETDRVGFLKQVGPGDLVVCSYGLALRDAAALQDVKWGTLVLDEAQFVKNAMTKTAKAICRISANWKVALTGTPIENRLSELWSIFRSVSPGMFGSWEDFRKKFAVPIERDDDEERRQALARIIRPFVLRRTKTEVLHDLPPRTETNLHVELSADERRRYDEMRLTALGEIDELAGLSDVKDQRFRVLAILTRLRQLACHVGLVDDSWSGGSAKLELLLETVKELRDEGHRALIFSQFTSFLAKTREALTEAGITFQYLDGSTPAKQRQQAVDAFQGGESDVFLISLRAGGTGLNLTAADYVIHLDPWWNPAVEDQATDRAHRIGQDRPVMVYRLIAQGTIEEQILDLHREKRDLVESIMDGTQSAAKLSTDELIALIRGKMSD